MRAPPVYYNEFDPKAAAWLRELIRQGLLPEGEVDERSIVDVRGHDLRGFRQHHFFAGIGGWPYALQLAGWPAAWPVWTGSCPCQPFSAAGKGLGIADERHLWPEFYRVNREYRECIDVSAVPVVFGEQVASAAGREWLVGVRADMEALGDVFGAADLCAAGVGAPHIRQRLFWVSHAASIRVERSTGKCCDSSSGDACSGGCKNRQSFELDTNCATGGVPHPGGEGLSERGGYRAVQRETLEPLQGQSTKRADHAGGLPHTSGARCTELGRERIEPARSAAPGFWSDFDILPFRDGKARRTQPRLSPLAHGVSARVVQLRGYGNAIVPQVAAEFVVAAMEAMDMMEQRARDAERELKEAGR